MTQRVLRKGLLALVVTSALAAGPAFAAKDVVVAVGSTHVPLLTCQRFCKNQFS